MIFQLLNRKYVRFIFQALILLLVLVILLRFLHSWVFNCIDKRLLNKDFNQENSILARIKIDNRDGGLVKFVASFDPDDLIRLWNRRHFTSKPFLSGSIPLVEIEKHNPELCSEENLEWIIFILTKPINFEQRALLRKTWAGVNLFKKRITKVIFVMGKSNDLVVQDKIDEEFSDHEDLVLGNFEDQANSETLKSVLAMKWISEHCKNARFTLKANDNSFIDIFGLMDLAKTLIKEDRSILCPLWLENTMPILRENCGDYCVPSEDFPDQKFFPQYCAGVAFLSHTGVIRDLYNASLRTPFFFIEDVYTTGILPLKLAKPPTFISCMSSFSTDFESVSKEYLNTLQNINVLITIIYDTKSFKKLWTSLIKRLQPAWLEKLSEEAIKENITRGQS